MPIVLITLSAPFTIGKIDAKRLPNENSNTRNAIGNPIISATFKSFCVLSLISLLIFGNPVGVTFNVALLSFSILSANCNVFSIRSLFVFPENKIVA